MKRRTYLGAGTVGALSAIAGCLDTPGMSESNDGTDPSDEAPPASDEAPPASDEAVLGPPETDLSASIHPTYGDEVPDFAFPDPFSGERISDDNFRGERVQLYTFYYTNCPDGICPALLRSLGTVNLSVRDEGHQDAAAFVPITFDPNRDTKNVIVRQAEKLNIDPETDDWFFLRPETWSAVENTLIAEDGGFGLPLTPGMGDESHGHGEGEDNESSNNESGSWTPPNDGDYTFPHFAFILLVNRQGIVERSYPNAHNVQPTRIEEDMLAVLEE